VSGAGSMSEESFFPGRRRGPDDFLAPAFALTGGGVSLGRASSGGGVGVGGRLETAPGAGVLLVRDRGGRREGLLPAAEGGGVGVGPAASRMTGALGGGVGVIDFVLAGALSEGGRIGVDRSRRGDGSGAAPVT
jgi:hypothetical protein